MNDDDYTLIDLIINQQKLVKLAIDKKDSEPPEDTSLKANDTVEEHKSKLSELIYTTTLNDKEEEEEEEKMEEEQHGNDNESESEYVSEFKTETIPESSVAESSVSTVSSEIGQAYEGLVKRYSGLPNYSTVHFISDYTRQFITLSLFTWLMVQKKKFAIAKRSIDKAHQILEKITTFSIRKEDFSFANLFEEENDYYPDIMLKFERVVVILAGTWLVESEKIVINYEKQQQQQEMMTSMESPPTSLTTAPTEIVLSSSTESTKKDETEFADEVVVLPKLSDDTQTPSTKDHSSSSITTKTSVVPKLSGYVEGLIKLIHYYQELLPYIGSDSIAMECFKTIQHYQNEYKKLCLEC